jgi:hypothetical protein
MFAFGLFAMSSTLFEFVALIGNRFGPSGALARSLKRAFPWAQSDKSWPGSQKLPLEGWGPLNKGCGRRTWALPDVSGGENALLSVFGVGGNAHEECYKDLIEAEKNATEEQIKKVLFLLQSAKDSNNSAVFRQVRAELDQATREFQLILHPKKPSGETGKGHPGNTESSRTNSVSNRTLKHVDTRLHLLRETVESLA